MATTTDWLPKKEQDLVDLCNSWRSVLSADGSNASFGWNSDLSADVEINIGVFLQARTAYQADNSTALRIAKDKAKRAAMASMRAFANSSVRYNPKVDEATRRALGIRPRDTTPTVHQPPALRPEMVVENTRNRYEHRLVALNPESRSAVKPADAYGVKYGWQVGGERPASGEDLPKSHFSRKATHTITYPESEKGKPVWYAVRYENAKGEAGPWSIIEEAFVG